MSNGKTDLNRPKAYDGAPEYVNTYIIHCSLQFASNPTLFNNDLKKKAYLLSFCTEGLAAPWAEGVIGSWMSEAPNPVLTWDDAKQQFKDKFLPANLKAAAMVQLKGMKHWQFKTFEAFLVNWEYQQTLAGITDLEHLR